MSDQLEQIPLSDELLAVMRGAARYALQLREPFVTARAMLLGLLDDPKIGPTIRADVYLGLSMGAASLFGWGQGYRLDELSGKEMPWTQTRPSPEST